MQKFFKLLVLGLIAINLILCAWYVLHNDILFHTDIARDFLLLQEIDEKKLVLLGPRSSTSGLFHGPLWLYLNYPAYVIGQGNPIVVGWYWILLIAVFLGTSFIIAKKLFNENTAYLFTLLLSFFLIFEARGLFNPHGAFFLLPAFFFFFIRNIQQLSPRNLLIFFFISGCIIQFQMAIGIPLLLLAAIPLIYKIFRQKKPVYLLTFLILFIPLATFILFDLKHQFIQLHSVFLYVFGNNLDTKKYGDLFGLIADRFSIITGPGFGIFKKSTVLINIMLTTLFALFLYIQYKDKKYRLIYASFLYFYVGYYLLSLVNKSGGMLSHYLMPLYPLVFLVFASFITSRYKKIFITIFFFTYLFNFTQVKSFIDTADNFIGKNLESWQFLKQMSEKVFQGPEQELGYFIYMPDSLAYQPKYAVAYTAKQTQKTVSYFKKKPVTYLVIAPPPPDKIGMEDSWWRINQARITTKTQSVINFPNGYKIEKYLLSEEDQKIPFDAAIDTGIHFR